MGIGEGWPPGGGGRLFVAVTDDEWYEYLRSRPQLREVNFWSPSPRPLANLDPGDVVLFKLRAPRNRIVGGGVFVHFSVLPLAFAWQVFGEANGAASIDDLEHRISRLRRREGENQAGAGEAIGCTVLADAFFVHPAAGVAVPADFAPTTQRGKGYRADTAEGRRLADAVWALRAAAQGGAALVAEAREPAARWGAPILYRPRIGQGAFRVLVADAYERRCAVTGERTLPVLEAAHVRPYSQGGEHATRNGILLRSDLHRLFDLGYVTIDPDNMRLEVSPRIRREFHNGRHYEALHGAPVARPAPGFEPVAREHLAYHRERIYRAG
ncbi:MAG: HNH endonuclease [Firmicutes bacterium]|nr:HNH endonuclease [Bacillota bacterium]